MRALALLILLLGETDEREFFESRIRPVLAQERYACHAASTRKKGGLTLDTLAPGAWRIISEETLARAFPGYSGQWSCPPDRMPAARRPRTPGGSL